MTDMQVNCSKCSTDFIFTVAEQEIFSNHGWPIPRQRCVPCTEKRKEKKRAYRKDDEVKDRKKAKREIEGTKDKKSRSAPAAAAEVDSAHRTKGKGAVPNGVCYNCSKPGHLSLDCPMPRSGKNAATSSERRSGSKADTCFRCGQVGHRSHDCPMPDTRDKSNKKGDTDGKGRGKGGKGASFGGGRGAAMRVSGVFKGEAPGPKGEALT